MRDGSSTAKNMRCSAVSGARATCFCVAAARTCGSQAVKLFFRHFATTFGRLADEEFSYLLLTMLCTETWCACHIVSYLGMCFMRCPG